MIVSVFVNLCLPPKHFRTKIGKIRSAAWEILCITRWRELCHGLKTWKSRSYLLTSSGVVQKSMMSPGPDKPRFQGRCQCRREWTSCASRCRAKSGRLCSCSFKKMLCVAEVVGYLGYLPVLFDFSAFHKVLVRSVLWLIALDRGKKAHWAPFSKLSNSVGEALKAAQGSCSGREGTALLPCHSPRAQGGLTGCQHVTARLRHPHRDEGSRGGP